MTQVQRGRERVLPRTNFSTDREILAEIAEEVGTCVGDIRYGSAVVDMLRSQITFTLEDGRRLLMTCRFDVKGA